jgi:type I restriction enzyme, R subunit
VEKKAAMKIALEDENAEIEPVPIGGGGWISDPEIDYLSHILESFNKQFGTLFTDADRASRRIKDDIAPKVAADQGYQNAKKNTPRRPGLSMTRSLNALSYPF